MTETMGNNTNMLAELVEVKVSLAKAEMQLEWQKAEQAKKDHSILEPEVMAPLFEALAKAQAEIGAVTATSRVTFKNVDFKFAPLSEILGSVRPALNKNGLTLTQQTKHIPFGNANGIKVVTTLHHESGASYAIESVPVFYNVNDIKNLGAQVTYLRRYEVKTLLGIEADSEELDMDNVPNQSQSTQETGNYGNNHTYLSNGVLFIPSGVLFFYSTCHYGASIHWPRTAYQKSLAEFAARRRQRNKIIFSRDMCVRENTAQAASVEFVRHRRTNYARSRLQSFCRKIPKEFSTVSKALRLMPKGLPFLADLCGQITLEPVVVVIKIHSPVSGAVGGAHPVGPIRLVVDLGALADVHTGGDGAQDFHIFYVRLFLVAVINLAIHTDSIGPNTVSFLFTPE